MINEDNPTIEPGKVLLFGSGETSPSGRKIFDSLFQKLHHSPQVALLETPSGFEPNSPQVVGRIADFLEQRLQNHAPRATIVPARKRGTPFSPDSPEILAPLLNADLIFMGPGSPTYAVRQLRDSLAWHFLVARTYLGGALALASAAVVAISAQALPVYEIYKAGADLHWLPGLDFFAPFGLPLTFIPHWNNNDGGAELDTSRCFMGRDRFAQLLEMLPGDQIVIGIDEHTALEIDCAGMCGQVMGAGTVTVLRNGHEDILQSGDSFDLGECSFSGFLDVLPPRVWEAALEARRVNLSAPEESQIPPEIAALVEQRQEARARKDWSAADALRDRIAALGWEILDTPQGPEINKP